MSEDVTLTPGSKLGDYTIVEEIGRGGMGVVYLAQHEYLKKRFALKVLPLDVSDLPEWSDMFRREAQTLGTLKHPNIVEVHNFGIVKGAQYLVLDYVEGGTIEDYCHKLGGKMPPTEVANTLLSVMAAIAHAHSLGIIHRDLKPENFLLDWDGTVKISDFGIAQLMDVDRDTTAGAVQASHQRQTMFELAKDQQESEPMTGGTEGYMAPEVEAGGTGDKRSDYYAIGVIAYYLLTGEFPEKGSPPATEVIKGLDKKWDALITRCMQKEPDRRYQTAEEVIGQLENITKIARPKWLIAGIAAAILIFATGTLMLFKNKKEKAKHEQQIRRMAMLRKDKPEKDSKQFNRPKLLQQSRPLAQARTDPQQTNQPPEKQPLIKNGSFERGLSNWENRGTAETSILKMNSAPDGAHVARMQSISKSGLSILSTPIRATWNDRITASVWVQTQAMSKNYPVDARMRLLAIDGNEQPIQYIDKQIKGVNGWTELRIDQVIPNSNSWPNVKKILLMLIYSNPSKKYASAFFDDVKVEVITPNDTRYGNPIDESEDLILSEGLAQKERPDFQPVAAKAPKTDNKSSDTSESTPSIPEMPDGMSELTLNVTTFDGSAITPGEYTLYLNGKIFEPLPSTSTFRFEGDREITFEVVAPQHREWQAHWHVPPGQKADLNVSLEAN